MNSTQKAELLQYFRAIGQPERLKILGLTANRPYTVMELAELLRLPETAVIHHIKRLQKKALVIFMDDAVTLNRQALEILHELVAPTEPVDMKTAVLRTFVQGERIRQFPAEAREKRVLLNWLADKFAPGRKYSRSRVEYLLQQHTPDYAWAQQQLLDARLLQEQNNIFQRIPAGKEAQDE
jgi:hypothetical protein